jgi:hypothetical protein
MSSTTTDVNNIVPSGHLPRSSPRPPSPMPSSWALLSRIEVSRRTNTEPELPWTQYHAPTPAVPLSNPSIATVRRLCSGRWAFACPKSYMDLNLRSRDLRQSLSRRRVRRRRILSNTSCHPPISATHHPVHTTAQTLCVNPRIRIQLPQQLQDRACLSSM